MPKTPRTEIPYPDFRKDPWFDDFENALNAIDGSLYAQREDRNLVLMDGGSIAWNSVSGLLSWGSDLTLSASITGLLWTVSAGTATLEDGEVLYVTLPRHPTGPVTVATNVATKVPSTDGALLLAIRNGTRVYWRTGHVLNNGDSEELFTDSGGNQTLEETLAEGNTTGGSDIVVESADGIQVDGDLRLTTRNAVPGAVAADELGLWASDGTVADTIEDRLYVSRASASAFARLDFARVELAGRDSVSGVAAATAVTLKLDRRPIEPAEYGESRIFTMVATVALSNSSSTVTVDLYNETDAEQVSLSGNTHTGDTAWTELRMTLTVGSAAGNLQDSRKIYGVELTIDSGSGVSDTAILGSCYLEVD